MFRTITAIILLISVILIGACGSTPVPPTPTSPPTLSTEITLYGWGDDIPDSVKDSFKEEYGVSINHLAYDTQEEALENIKAGEVYDVVVFDNNNVAAAIQDGLLAEIDHANILNFSNILPNFRDLTFDPKNKYSVPFTWGTTAFLVPTDLKDRATTWQEMWELSSVGKIAIRDEDRETLGFSLKSLGYSINTEDPQELEAAVDHLLEIKDKLIIAGSYSEEAIPLFESEGVVALIGWVDDALYAQEGDMDLVYVYPEDGAILWGDSFVIPANSPNKYTAEVFLDFLMRPEIAALITNESYYITANEGAADFVDAEIRNDPVVFPPREVLGTGEVILAHSPEGREAFEQAWERFMAEMQP